MTVLVESSVLIQAQRLPDSREAMELAGLLDSGEAAVTGPVIMEYLRGSRSSQELEFLEERIASVDYLDMDRQSWVIASRLSNRYMRTGDSMSDMDVAIAAVAVRYDIPLYTLDNGFAKVHEIRLYQPSSG